LKDDEADFVDGDEDGNVQENDSSNQVEAPQDANE